MDHLRRVIWLCAVLAAVALFAAPEEAQAQDDCGRCVECAAHETNKDCDTFGGGNGWTLNGCDGPCFYPQNNCSIVPGTYRDCNEEPTPEAVAEIEAAFERRATLAWNSGAATPGTLIDGLIPGTVVVASPISFDIPPAGVTLTEWVELSRRLTCPTARQATMTDDS